MISIPQRAQSGSILRSESAIDLLNRVRKFSTEWVKNGHNNGYNTHNVSATVSVKQDEWDIVKEWMWDNRDVYNGLAIFPHNTYETKYPQAPFEDCDEVTYNEMVSHIREIDLTQVWESEDMTNLEGEIACAGGMCEIDFNYGEK